MASAFKGSAAYISGDYMLIDAPQIAFDLLGTCRAREKQIREAIQQVTGRVYKLGPYKPQPQWTAKNRKIRSTPLRTICAQAGVEIRRKINNYKTDSR